MPASAARCTASATRSSEVRADRHVQRGGRHPGAQALQHRVAAEHRLRGLAVAGPAPVAGRARARSRPVRVAAAAARAARRAAGWPGPHLLGRGRALALQRPPALAAGADDHALLGAVLAHRAAPFRVAGHRVHYASFSDQVGPSGGVLDGHPGGGEPGAHGVGGGEVAAGPGLLAAARAGRRPGCASAPVAASARPGRRPATAGRAGRARARRSSPAPTPRRRRRAVRSPASSAVLPSRTASWIAASAPGVPRSSSMAAANVRVRTPDLRSADPLADPVHERLDPPVGGHRLLQRRVGVLDRRPVVRADQVVAQLDAAHPPQQRVDGQRVAQRLGHLLAAHGDPARCAASTGRTRRRPRATGPARSRGAGTPGPGRRRGCRTPAPRYMRGHRRALEVPAGPAAAPRRRPGRLARLGRLPQREVERVALGAALALALGHVVEPLAGTARRTPGTSAPRSRRRRRPGRRARARSAARSARPSAGRARWPAARSTAAGSPARRRRPGTPARGWHPTPTTAARRRPALTRILSSMSVTLRTSSDVQPLVGQPAAQHVVVEPGADVPDVRQALHGGATDVDRRSPGPQRHEVPLCSWWRCRTGAGSHVPDYGPANRPLDQGSSHSSTTRADAESKVTAMTEILELYPRLVVEGADAALDFYTAAFDGEVSERYTGPDGRVVHAMVVAGPVRFAVKDADDVRPGPDRRRRPGDHRAVRVRPGRGGCADGGRRRDRDVPGGRPALRRARRPAGRPVRPPVDDRRPHRAAHATS